MDRHKREIGRRSDQVEKRWSELSFSSRVRERERETEQVRPCPNDFWLKHVEKKRLTRYSLYLVESEFKTD